jgi:geranylgeranyl diphosphate synthase, type I
MNLANIQDELEGNASRVSQFILSSLKGQPNELYEASAHYIVSGGKRLRPFLVTKSCEMFGGTSKVALPAAAAVELIHNFSLVHDDIMDNDDVRHGVPTVHKSYGTALAILAGDILFSKAFQLISVDGKKAGIDDRAIATMIAKLATACIYVCEGQAIDIGLASNQRSFPEPTYLNMITKKTAALFDLSCTLGVLSAPLSSDLDIQNLSSFGLNVGIAFQLIDDLLGVTGDPKITGKSVGNDLREGKKTFPIQLALNNTEGEKRRKILRVLGSKKTTNYEISEAIESICSSGIDFHIRNIARSHIEAALRSIDGYTNSASKRALQLSANFVVERSL